MAMDYLLEEYEESFSNFHYDYYNEVCEKSEEIKIGSNALLFIFSIIIILWKHELSHQHLYLQLGHLWHCLHRRSPLLGNLPCKGTSVTRYCVQDFDFGLFHWVLQQHLLPYYHDHLQVFGWGPLSVWREFFKSLAWSFSVSRHVIDQYYTSKTPCLPFNLLLISIYFQSIQGYTPQGQWIQQL